MRKDIIYDIWLTYTEYEKADCDIKLKDGTIIYHCWPNAGKFNPLCSDLDPIPEEDVIEIMYKRYYSYDTCKWNCNGDHPEREIEYILNKEEMDILHQTNQEVDPHIYTEKYVEWGNHDWFFNNSFPMREYTPPYVREEPKIQRNEICSCGSGKKYKKCCI
jgi:hypothetical protein